MESLLSHSFGDQALSPEWPATPTYTDIPSHDAPVPDHSFNAVDLYLKLSTLLKKDLASTAAKITGDIKVNLQNIGSRMDAIECKLDQTTAVSHQNSDLIQTLHDQLDTAFSCIEDLEGRSRSYNFRIRGLPESILDVLMATQDLMRSLIPNIPLPLWSWTELIEFWVTPGRMAPAETSLQSPTSMPSKRRSRNKHMPCPR